MISKTFEECSDVKKITNSKGLASKLGCQLNCLNLVRPTQGTGKLSFRGHKLRNSSCLTLDADVTYFLSFHAAGLLDTCLTLWEEALVNDSVTQRHCKCHCRKIRTGSPLSPFSPFPPGTPGSPCLWREHIIDSDWQQRQGEKTESCERETWARAVAMNK